MQEQQQEAEQRPQQLQQEEGEQQLRQQQQQQEKEEGEKLTWEEEQQQEQQQQKEQQEEQQQQQQQPEVKEGVWQFHGKEHNKEAPAKLPLNWKALWTEDHRGMPTIASSLSAAVSGAAARRLRLQGLCWAACHGLLAVATSWESVAASGWMSGAEGIGSFSSSASAAMEEGQQEQQHRDLSSCFAETCGALEMALSIVEMAGVVGGGKPAAATPSAGTAAAGATGQAGAGAAQAAQEGAGAAQAAPGAAQAGAGAAAQAGAEAAEEAAAATEVRQAGTATAAAAGPEASSDGKGLAMEGPSMAAPPVTAGHNWVIGCGEGSAAYGITR